MQKGKRIGSDHGCYLAGGNLSMPVKNRSNCLSRLLPVGNLRAYVKLSGRLPLGSHHRFVNTVDVLVDHC